MGLDTGLARMLVALGGLPGTGKTTLGKALAIRWSAVYLRVDEVEQALRRSRNGDVGAAGYAVAQAVARSNLELGRSVIADSVNPVPASREAWRQIAHAAGCPILEIELICTNRAEHRRRVESRTSDIQGLTLPTWASVEAHDYVVWREPHLLLDTATLSPADVLERVETHLRAEARSGPDALPR